MQYGDRLIAGASDVSRKRRNFRAKPPVKCPHFPVRLPEVSRTCSCASTAIDPRFRSVPLIPPEECKFLCYSICGFCNKCGLLMTQHQSTLRIRRIERDARRPISCHLLQVNRPSNYLQIWPSMRYVPKFRTCFRLLYLRKLRK